MQVGIVFMGHDFILDIDWTLTHRGSPARTYGPPEDCDPGSDPEWDINTIHMQHDMPGELGPAFEATGSLFDVLASLRAVDDAILQYIWEYEEDEDDYYDEDDRH